MEKRDIMLAGLDIMAKKMMSAAKGKDPTLAISVLDSTADTLMIDLLKAEYEDRPRVQL